MKRHLLALMLVTTLGADGAFDGLYGGGSIGLLTSSASVRQISPMLDAESITVGSVNQQRVIACDSTLWGELYLGYGCRFCSCFYLGGRLGANFSGGEVVAESSYDVPPFEQDPGSKRAQRARIEMNDVEPTLDAKGGWLPCDSTMVFGLLGLSLNRVTLTVERALEPVQLLDIASVASHVLGLRVGLGVEQLFCCHYGLSLAYVYTFYPRRHQERLVPVSESLSGLQTTRASPARQTASIGLAYYF
jgi:hypothetical protein